MAVFALLSALMFPLFSRLRERDANTSNCQTNLMQIGQAIAQYTQDNGGRLPIVASQKVDTARVNATGVGQVGSQAGHWGWIEAIAPYITVSSPYTQLSQVFICPSDLDRQRAGAGGSSYAMNRYLGWTPSLSPSIGVAGCAPSDNDVQRCADLPYLKSDITIPDQKVLVTEFAQVRNNGAVINSPVNQRGYYSITPLRSVNFANFASFDHKHNAQGPLLTVIANHGASGNVLFVDGHVGAVKSFLDTNTEPTTSNEWIPLTNSAGGGQGWAVHWYPTSQYDDSIRALMQSTLTDLATQSSPSDTQYFANGVWNYTGRVAGDSAQLAISSEAATLWRATLPRNPQYYNWAVQSIDNWIDTQQHADGRMADVSKPDTQFACNEIICCYLMLEPSLDQAHKDKWKLALTSAVLGLQNNNLMPNDAGTGGWYTNGNIELEECELAYGTYLVTGDVKYKTLYNRQLAYTLNPPASSNNGPPNNFGMIYTDAAHTKGYLVERPNGGTPGHDTTGYSGYDGNYTHFQLSIASRLYLMSRDPQILGLANAFMNQLLPYLNQTNWHLDISNGSRRPLPDGNGVYHPDYLDFITSGLGTLGWQGGRTDLAPKFMSQFDTVIKPDLSVNASDNSKGGNLNRAYADLATLMDASGGLTPPVRTGP